MVHISHKYYPLSILITAAVIFLSLSDFSHMKIDQFNLSDKVVHGIMYAGMASVFWFEYLINDRCTLSAIKILVWLILAPILLGGLLEIMQEHLTDYRSGDWFDFVADIAGVVLAAAIGLNVQRPVIRRFQSARNSMDEK